MISVIFHFSLPVSNILNITSRVLIQYLKRPTRGQHQHTFLVGCSWWTLQKCSIWVSHNLSVRRLSNTANTSALLLGLWPTNQLTPWKHKQIDTLHRDPDNPCFHLHSRLSSITGIQSLVSSLVTRQTDRSHDPQFDLIKLQGLDLWSASVRSLRWASHWMATEHQKAKMVE